jgi:Bacterial Ig-like domain (group 3)
MLARMCTKVTAINNLMTTIKNSLLALCLGLAFAPQSGTGEVPGDTNSLQGAIFLATNNIYPHKTIFLVVSDTNGCSACRALSSTGLPNPSVLQFLRESFVYWPCGPNEHCTAFQQYLGSGTIPVPQLLMIDPTHPSTYFSVSVGFGGASGLKDTMRLGLLRGTAPYVTRLEDKNSPDSPGNHLDITSANWKNINTISFSNIVVKCHSISTNVVLYRVKYKLDTTNGWSSLTIANQTAWDLSLNPAQIVPGVNVLRFYATDINATGTRTNVFTFNYNANGVVQNPTTTALNSSANPTTYGQTVTFTATVTSGSSPVTEGTITFKDGVTTLGTGTPNGSGMATLATSALSAGSHPITAVYTDSSSFAGSTSSAVSQTVNKADPNVTAWPTASAINYGQTLASSTLSGGSATPAGGFAFTTPSTVPAATAQQSVTYTPTDTANYNTASGSVNVPVILPLLGDANNNGRVEASELNQVFANYWSATTNVLMTNPAVLCNGFFQFSVTNTSGWNLRVYASTNLSDWTPLTAPASPVYQFKDPGATGGQRYYRLAP